MHFFHPIANARNLVRLMLAALVAATMVATNASFASAADYDEGGHPLLSHQELELMYSETPVTLLVDAATGNVLSVTETALVDASPFAATPNDCSGNRTCWLGWLAPTNEVTGIQVQLGLPAR